MIYNINLYLMLFVKSSSVSNCCNTQEDTLMLRLCSSSNTLFSGIR